MSTVISILSFDIGIKLMLPVDYILRVPLSKLMLPLFLYIMYIRCNTKYSNLLWCTCSISQKLLVSHFSVNSLVYTFFFGIASIISPCILHRNYKHLISTHNFTNVSHSTGIMLDSDITSNQAQ